MHCLERAVLLPMLAYWGIPPVNNVGHAADQLRDTPCSAFFNRP